MHCVPFFLPAAVTQTLDYFTRFVHLVRFHFGCFWSLSWSCFLLLLLLLLLIPIQIQIRLRLRPLFLFAFHVERTNERFHLSFCWICLSLLALKGFEIVYCLARSWEPVFELDFVLAASHFSHLVSRPIAASLSWLRASKCSLFRLLFQLPSILSPVCGTDTFPMGQWLKGHWKCVQLIDGCWVWTSVNSHDLNKLLVLWTERLEITNNLYLRTQALHKTELYCF